MNDYLYLMKEDIKRLLRGMWGVISTIWSYAICIMLLASGTMVLCFVIIAGIMYLDKGYLTDQLSMMLGGSLIVFVMCALIIWLDDLKTRVKIRRK